MVEQGWQKMSSKFYTLTEHGLSYADKIVRLTGGE